VRRLLSALAATALAVTLLSGSSAAAQEADLMSGAPQVGECHDVTLKQAYGKTLREEPVPCSADHTLKLVKIVHVPDGIDMSDTDAVNEAIPDCSPAAVGKDPLLRGLTLYSSFLFYPTKAQVKAGARWASCHVGVWDTRGLNDLPDPLPRVTKRPADSVARCANATKSQFVTCAEPHAYRARAATFVRVRGSNAAVAETMSERGPAICARRLGGRGFTHWFRVNRTKALLTCMAKTSR
jgi:hypothetical protein